MRSQTLLGEGSPARFPLEILESARDICVKRNDRQHNSCTGELNREVGEFV